MSRTISLTLLFVAFLVSKTEGQSPDMRRLVLRGGVVVDLPRAWVLRDSSNLQSLNDTVVSHLRNMNPEWAPLLVDRSRASMILVADGPAWTTATLGIGPAPGVTPGYFATLSPHQLNAYRTALCQLLTDAQRVQHLPAPTCGVLVQDSAQHRVVLVMQYDREEARGDVHVFAVQVPTTDAIVTLTLMSRPETAKDNAPLFRRLWRSLTVPDTLR